ncbi:MAG TPA: DMT family transporter [Candidatus Limnocylindrales bacterium]|nr:DMT family transporter [Candidatus Limnocylindrales bacterium]
MTSPQLRGAIYGLSAAAIWGGMYVVSDVVLQVIPPFTLLSLRLLLSMLILGLLAWLTHPPRPATRADYGRILLVGFVGFGISLGAQFVGTDLSNAVNGALITSASPAFILIFAVLLLHERLTGLRVAAVALATLGVVVIINPSEAGFTSNAFLGNMALAVAALTWGLYSVLVRQLSGRVDTLVFSFLAPAGGLLLTLPAAAVELQSRPVGEITPAVIAGVFYLSAISTALAMWMWNRAFALVDASTASLFFFAQPLVGAVLSVVLLGQVMTGGLWLGGAMIGAGVLLALLGDRWRRVRIGSKD